MKPKKNANKGLDLGFEKLRELTQPQMRSALGGRSCFNNSAGCTTTGSTWTPSA